MKKILIGVAIVSTVFASSAYALDMSEVIGGAVGGAVGSRFA